MISNSNQLRAGFMLAVLLCIQSGCQAYPELFAAKHATTSCIDHPSQFQRYGAHGRVIIDTNVTIQVTQGDKPVKVLCPGGQYEVKVAFSGPRLALVTASMATLKDATNQSCPNQLVTPRKKRVRNVTTTMTVSCAASGRELDFKVTTGSRRTSALAFARTMIPVDSAGAPRCAMISAACSPARPAQIIGQAADAAATPAAGSADSTTTFVPLTPSNVDTSKTEAVEAARAKTMQEPVYQFYPVLNENRWLWQFLHSVLMLLSFCFLLPLGSLLARHKWMFGRDPLSGRVLTSWGPVHVITQILGLLAAIAGVVIAILAFGWKDVPGQKLYLPHKWTGVGVIGMALIQGVLGMLRPQPEARGRGMWDTLHHSWGRITIIAGMGNAILGALLIHDLKDESYLHWLLPACILVGVVGILALTLEAFKVQMQRTYRYHSKTGNMLPVLEGYKHSQRRPGGNAARFVGGLPSDHHSDSDDGQIGQHLHDVDDVAMSDQATHYPSVTHRAGPVKTSIKPPQFD